MTTKNILITIIVILQLTLNMHLFSSIEAIKSREEITVGRVRSFEERITKLEKSAHLHYTNIVSTERLKDLNEICKWASKDFRFGLFLDWDEEHGYSCWYFNIRYSIDALEIAYLKSQIKNK